MVRNNKKRFNLTIFIYLFIFFALILIVSIASSKVLFRPWTARKFSAVVQIEDRVYLFGGVDDSGESRSEIMMIDMEKQALYRIGNLPKPAYSSATAVYNGMIYLAGGLSDKQYLDKVYRFDPESETVQAMKDLPFPAAFGSMSAVGDSLYYIGGFDGELLRSDIIEIDPETGSAVVKAVLPQPLEYHRSITAGSVIYIIGGENDQREYSSSVYAYSPAENSIKELEGRISPVSRFGIVKEQSGSPAGTIIIAGGWGNGQRNDFRSLLFENSLCSEEIIGTIPEPFSDVELISWNGKLYLAGGTEPEYKRQIRFVKIDSENMANEDIKLKSYVWR